MHAGSLLRNEATVILVTNIFAFYTMKSQFYLKKKTSIPKTKRLINTDGEKCLFKLENVIY